MSANHEQKRALRQEILGRRRALGAVERAAASLRICQQILTLPIYQQSRHVAAYAPMAEEVNISAIFEDCWRHDRVLALPQITDFEARKMVFRHFRQSADLITGAKGILEPARRRSCDRERFI